MEILKEMGIPDHLTCLLRNRYAGQEAAVRMGHATTDWFQIWKTQQWPQDWIRSVLILIPKKGNPKNAQTTPQLHSSHTLVKVMLKILQARLQQYVNHDFQMFKLVLEKAEEPEIKLPTSTGSLKKQESSRRTSFSALLTIPKPLTVWIPRN